MRPTWDLCVLCGPPHTREPEQFAARLCDDCFAEACLAWLDGEAQRPTGPTVTQQARPDMQMEMRW
jgi:hypothetical protein